MEPKRLDLGAVYNLEAERIAEARRQAITIHASGDIRAAGEQVEQTVRGIIGARLPPRYRTAHGHILDYNGRVSSQLDVIIAENLATKSLFEAADGTEYLPYESVYAFGEIKSTYYKSEEPIQTFSKSILSVKTKLTRQTHVSHPLLTFMVFVAANDFHFSELENFYRNTPPEHLPTFVCLLDLGTIVFLEFLLNGHGQPVPVHYHLASPAKIPPDEKHKWSLIQWGKEGSRGGANLMFLHLALIQHLHECGSSAPNLYPYFVLSLDWDKGESFQ